MKDKLERAFQEFLKKVYKDMQLDQDQMQAIRVTFSSGMIVGYNLTMDAATSHKDDNVCETNIEELIDGLKEYNEEAYV